MRNASKVRRERRRKSAEERSGRRKKGDAVDILRVMYEDVLVSYRDERTSVPCVRVYSLPATRAPLCAAVSREGCACCGVDGFSFFFFFFLDRRNATTKANAKQKYTCIRIPITAGLRAELLIRDAVP